MVVMIYGMAKWLGSVDILIFIRHSGESRNPEMLV